MLLLKNSFILLSGICLTWLSVLGLTDAMKIRKSNATREIIHNQRLIKEPVTENIFVNLAILIIKIVTNAITVCSKKTQK